LISGALEPPTLNKLQELQRV